MTLWIIIPLILPAMVAASMVLLVRNDLRSQRLVSLAASLLLLFTTLYLLVLSQDGVIRPYLLGNWPAPFGIVLVLDRLSAIMLALTALLACLIVLYAMNGWDERGRHFHTLLHFNVFGVNGAFLTADIFNLFVFFEVMLIASYGLMLHGGGPQRLKAGFQYVAINLVASTLFLFAVGLIYAVTGTLNMADLALKVPNVPHSDQALLTTGAVLLFVVFGIKAALAPLHWWLPTAYAAAPPLAAAHFMIMTKVGAYAIIRVYGLVFSPDAEAASLPVALLIPFALVTLAIGSLGVLASGTLRGLACFATLASMGTLLIAVGLFNEAGLATALFYLLHSTIAGAALFLLADIVAARRGEAQDRLVSAAPFENQAVLGFLFLGAAIAMVGLPPLSGFLGKLMVLDATRDAQLVSWIWSVVLITSLLMLIGFARAGSVLFWKSAATPATAVRSDAKTGLPLVVAGLLVSFGVVLSVLAGPIFAHVQGAARQVLAPAAYIEAVLGRSAALDRFSATREPVRPEKMPRARESGSGFDSIKTGTVLATQDSVWSRN